MAAAVCSKRPAAVLGAQRPASCSKRRRRIRVHNLIGSTEEYEETEILGEGASGVVLQARHRVTGDTVAIKFPRYTDDRPADATQLLREARFLAACAGNPHVVASRGLLLDPATAGLCLAMEHVDGPNLRSLLQSRRTPLSEAVVRGYMRQLLAGAAQMHARGVVHRDIKPSNILLARQDGGKTVTVKLCDLGLAMSLAAAATTERPYGDVGTVPYMAPEMLLGKPDYDARVDAWSLGCVMAEMLLPVPAGTRLFAGARNEDDEIGQLWAIFRVLGLPDETTWPEFESLPLAGMVPRLFLQSPARQGGNRLRELFGEEVLSDEGFRVLEGLLVCNPDRRLTPAAALRLPWLLPAELDTRYRRPPGKKNGLMQTKVTPMQDK